MALYLRALIAFVPGALLCLSDGKLLKLAIWPWSVGVICYFVSFFIAWHVHGTALPSIVGLPDSPLSYVVYVVVWVGLLFVLLAAALFLSIVVVHMFTGFLQSAITRRVLEQKGVVLPDRSGAPALGAAAELSRSLWTECRKALFILPLGAALFVAAFFPPLVIVVAILAAWMLAYQFVDIVLELHAISFKERVNFCRREAGLLICFGFGLTLFWVIPFAGILLPPFAAAGCGWLFADSAISSRLPRRALSEGSSESVRDVPVPS